MLVQERLVFFNMPRWRLPQVHPASLLLTPGILVGVPTGTASGTAGCCAPTSAAPSRCSRWAGWHDWTWVYPFGGQANLSGVGRVSPCLLVSLGLLSAPPPCPAAQQGLCHHPHHPGALQCLAGSRGVRPHAQLRCSQLALSSRVPPPAQHYEACSAPLLPLLQVLLMAFVVSTLFWREVRQHEAWALAVEVPCSGTPGSTAGNPTCPFPQYRRLNSRVAGQEQCGGRQLLLRSHLL